MKKVFYALALLFLTVAFTGCQKASTQKIVSTRETTKDGKTIVEATFSDGKQLYNCVSLQSIELPANIKELRRGVFSGCSSLMSVTCRAVSPPSVVDPFPGCPIQEIKVPAESVSNYKTTLGWMPYADKIVGY